MKKAVYILLTISLFHSFAGAQWVQQNGGTTVTLYNIDFVDVNTGWIVGTASKILKTTNGGLNWVTQIPSIPLNRELNDIQMFDANTGYIAGWTNTFLKTTNGGDNWVQLSGPSVTNGSLNAISFNDVNTGWVCAFLGIIWRTTNGGLTWDSLNTGNTAQLRDIQFINSQTGWVTGDVGYMRKTTNGGLNWFFQFFGTFSDYWYNSLMFINVNTGWVVSYNNKIFRTTNAGLNWDSVANTPGVCLHFINAFTGWTGGDNGDIYKTTNGGLNFYQQSIPVTGGFFTDIEFVNDTTGWAVDVYAILHTTNGGTYVAIEPISNNIPNEFRLFQNYPNPFNPVTTIEFELPIEDNIKILVYDILGREVNRINENRLKAGKYKFEFSGEALSSGIYFYTLYYSKGKISKKMILNK
ncbi:MAG: T9SS type A sorting domain-containing protein [Ignavibacteria bacterium]|nr:T9SS type A sorting domain-containing protein [Ignavibacteria bacterium]